MWKVDSFATFTSKVQDYLNRKYRGKAIPLIPKETKRVIEDYIKRGYEYFAFDIVNEPGKKFAKQTIMYNFETPKGELYYPLVISQSGGKGDTAIELLMITNKETLTYADKKAEGVVVSKFRNRFPKFSKAILTRDQVKRIDPQFLKLFNQNDKLYARWYVTKGATDIRSFADDFRLIVK